MQVISSLSAGCSVGGGGGVGGGDGGGVFVSLAALEELGQRVPQLGQLEDLAVQQLQQGAQALAKGFPLLLAALQMLLQVAQLGLQRLVPRLRVLKQTTNKHA